MDDVLSTYSVGGVTWAWFTRPSPSEKVGRFVVGTTTSCLGVRIVKFCIFCICELLLESFICSRRRTEVSILTTVLKLGRFMARVLLSGTFREAEEMTEISESEKLTPSDLLLFGLWLL